MLDKRYDTLADALARARSDENQTGTFYFVVRTTDGYEVTGIMPLLGEWYDSGGIRHG